MSGRAATHRRAPCFPWPGYGPMTAGATSPRTATTTGPCACPIRRARKPCCGTTNYTMSRSCSTGISAPAQGASAVRFFSISRRPAIRTRRAASPFRHAIWRACRPICRSERFSGSRDSDRRRRYGRGARVPEASAARPLRVSYRRPRPAAAAATLPSGSPDSASRSSPVVALGQARFAAGGENEGAARSRDSTKRRRALRARRGLPAELPEFAA